MEEKELLEIEAREKEQASKNVKEMVQRKRALSSFVVSARAAIQV